MKIDCGKYILQTDSFKNMWIEEKYMGETKDKEPKEATRRVSGYLNNIESLSKDFLEKKLYGSDEEQIVNVMNELKQAQNDIDLIVKKYKEVIK